MLAKFKGTCVSCRISIEVGEECYHDRESRMVRCVKCSPRSASERSISATGKVKMPYDANLLPLLKSSPGARWNPNEKCWTVSVSDADLPRTLEIAERLGLDIAPELTARNKPTAQAQAVDSRLYPYQIKGVDHISRRAKSLLTDEMGLGKTPQTLAALPQDGSAAVLVVCPNTLKYNWVKEAQKWAPGYKTAVLTKQTFRFPNKGEIVTINYEGLPSEMAGTWQKPSKMDIPAGLTVVFDEVHYAKNYKAARSQKVYTLASKAAKVVALTGTPLANRPFDLWGVLCSCGMNREVFGTFEKFCQLFNAEQDQWGGWHFGTPSVEVPERLRRVMLRRLRTEVLPELPGKQYSEVVVNGISASMSKQMDKLQEKWLDDGFDSNELPPFEWFSKIRAGLAESRIDAMLEMVENFEESETPLVVFSAHRAPVDTLAARPGWKTITGDTKPQDRQTIVDEFQAGKLKGIALTIAAGGTGITLTRASHMLFVDLAWVPADNAQAEDRICRIGQEASSCQYIRMVSDHPLDRHVQDLLVSKMNMARAAVDAEVRAKVKPVASAQSTTEQELHNAVVASPQDAVARMVYADYLEENGKAAEADSHRKVAEKIKEEVPVTEELRTAVHSALRMLAGMCDGARMLDGAGFNRFDTSFGHSLANCSWLSDRATLSARRMLIKYRAQLPADLYAIIKSS